MYLRTVKARGGAGKSHEYIRLVEAYWENGQAKQRTVANLGRKDILAPHVDALVRILRGDEPSGPSQVRAGDVNPLEAAVWGPMLAARTLWRELGLESILEGCGGRIRRDPVALGDRVLVLVANRLSQPGSEHGLAGWLETDFVCNRQGRRFVAKWKQQRRVRVDLGWLQHWYRTLDRLLPLKERIEKELFERLKDLFRFEVEIVFYDLTSTYFEGRGPGGFAKHGYSRDGKPRDRQVLVGVVMINGWPIAHHVFAGNLRDEKTVLGVVEDLQKRFGLKRVIFVGDRGMVTAENLATLRKREQGYLVGLQRRRREKVYRYIERATGAWIECPVGITAREKTQPPKTRVQEVSSDEPGVRVFVVESDERLEYERGMREQSMRRTREALEKLQKRVAAGKLKAPEKIGETAGRILARNHGQRYYDWELKEGTFRFFEHPVHLAREKAYEGKYLIQTEEKHLGAVEAVQAYKELSEVERGFRQLKDVIEMRPIYHRKKERVQAHIFVAALAFLLDRAIEKKLKAAGVPLSSQEALKALRTVHVVDIKVGGGVRRGTTAGSSRAREVLTALGISDREPPKWMGKPEMATC
jgi:transposase